MPITDQTNQNQTDAGQIKIQNLEKENEEIKREMQFLRDSVQNMQVRAVGPNPQVMPQTVPVTAIAPNTSPQTTNVGMVPSGPPPANVYGYPFPNHLHGSLPQTNPGGYVNNSQAGPAMGQNQAPMNPTGVNGAGGRRPPQCYNCNGYGHIKRDCPAPPRQSTGNPYNNGGNRPLQNMMLKDAGSRSYLEVEIAGNKHLCLLDSGSDVTLIPASIARGRKLTHTTQKLFAAGGRKLPLMGTTRVTIKIR